MNMRKGKVISFKNRGGMRIAMLVSGIFLVLISPIIGAIPGPGFIIVFPVGLALILKSSLTAKRLYARFVHRFPRYGNWANRLLRQRYRRKAKEAAKTDASNTT
ncbi:hypothetical protein [Sphingorhabdus sp. Alg239-R122]|uniref:hypothetical protein n=1 Tax=Sphingorhabdus sp. Alg239-R122 TaxID=2305989 RepID=UPI001F07C617|nr:hypothetical protein [Sphingorhabdus sp. Alg239-R122]